MSTDLDPRLEDAARRQLGRLLDAIDVGAPPATPRAATEDDPPVLHLDGRDPARRAVPRPGPRRRVLVAVAAAAAFVLGVGVAVVLRSAGDGATDPATEPGPDVTNEVPRVVPGHLPAGTEPLYSTRLPLPADELDPGWADVTAYGEPRAHDPFDAVDLGVIVVHDETVGLAGTEATVRGGPGRVGEGEGGNDLGLTSRAGRPLHWVSWSATPEVEVTLASRTLALDAVRALAETAEVTVDGDDTTVSLPDLPAGLAELGTLRGLTFGGPTFVPGAAPGWYDVYDRADAGPPLAGPEAPPMEVATFAGTAEQALAARWMADGFTEDGVLRRPGWVAASFPLAWTGNVTAMWEAAPGVIVAVREVGDLETLADYRLEPAG